MAAEALGALQAREAVPHLFALLDKGGRSLRSAAAEALRQIEGRGQAVALTLAPAAVREWFEDLAAGLEELLGPGW